MSISDNQWSWLRSGLYTLCGMLWAEHKGHSPISLAAFLYGYAALAISAICQLVWIILKFSLEWRKRGAEK